MGETPTTNYWFADRGGGGEVGVVVVDFKLLIKLQFPI